MEHLVGINNNVLVKWRLLRDNGRPFPVDEYALRISVIAPRGRSEIKRFSITGSDNNIVSWEMNNQELRFLGGATLVMSILRRGLQIATVECRNAFAISKRSGRGCDCEQVIEISSFVHILHPEAVSGQVAVIFPSFELDENMHLWLKGSTEAYSSNFSLGQDGHLYFENND